MPNKPTPTHEELLDDVLILMLGDAVSKMPPGPAKRNGQIMLLAYNIRFALDAITEKACKAESDAFDAADSKLLFDYLRQLNLRIHILCSDLGLEVHHV